MVPVMGQCHCSKAGRGQRPPRYFFRAGSAAAQTLCSLLQKRPFLFWLYVGPQGICEISGKTKVFWCLLHKIKCLRYNNRSYHQT